MASRLNFLRKIPGRETRQNPKGRKTHGPCHIDHCAIGFFGCRDYITGVGTHSSFQENALYKKITSHVDYGVVFSVTSVKHTRW